MPPSVQGLGAAAWWTPLLVWASFVVSRGRTQTLIPAWGVSCLASLPLFVVDDGVEGLGPGVHPGMGGKLPYHAAPIRC